MVNTITAPKWVAFGRSLSARARPIGFCAATITASRLCLLLIGYLSQRLLASQAGADPLTDLFQRWDAPWYAGIACDGYHLATDFAHSGCTNVNFMPLMPALESALLVVMPLKAALLILPLLFLLVGAVVLYESVSERFDEHVARMTIASLCFFPGSFVFSSPMTEALFFMLSVIGFRCLASRNWVPGGLTAALMTVTRLNGVLMSVAMAVAWVEDRYSKGLTPTTFRELLLIVLTPLPLLCFLAFLFWRFHDGFAIFHSQRYFWGNRFDGLFHNLFQVFDWKEQLSGRVESGLALFAVVVFLTQIRCFTLEESVFVLLSIVVATMSERAILSTLRYLLPLYPIHIAFGRIASRRGGTEILIPCLAIINGFLMVLWSQGGAVFV